MYLVFQLHYVMDNEEKYIRAKENIANVLKGSLPDFSRSCLQADDFSQNFIPDRIKTTNISIIALK